MTEAGQRFLAGARRARAADLREDRSRRDRAGRGAAAAHCGSPRRSCSAPPPCAAAGHSVSRYDTRRSPVRLALLDRSVDLVKKASTLRSASARLPNTSAIATRIGALRRVVIASPGYMERRGRPAGDAGRSCAPRHHRLFVGIDGAARWTHSPGRRGSRDQAAAHRQHRGGRAPTPQLRDSASHGC